MNWLRLERCLLWGLAGVGLGFAALAWGQGVAKPPAVTPLDSDLVFLLEAGKVLGLPGVLGFLAFQLGRWVNRIVFTVRLHPDDLAQIDRIAFTVRLHPDDLAQIQRTLKDDEGT